jgi:hypothetical protein
MPAAGHGNSDSRDAAILLRGRGQDNSWPPACPSAPASPTVAATRPLSAYSDTDLASGQVTLPVDTSAESFVRTQVLDASGNTVAVSNPAWLLQNVPPQGIPFPRRA